MCPWNSLFLNCLHVPLAVHNGGGVAHVHYEQLWDHIAHGHYEQLRDRAATHVHYEQIRDCVAHGHYEQLTDDCENTCLWSCMPLIERWS